jgi:hypothetical protein
MRRASTQTFSPDAPGNLVSGMPAWFGITRITRYHCADNTRSQDNSSVQRQAAIAQGDNPWLSNGIC